MSKIKAIGYCKECNGLVTQSEEMKPDYPNLYECKYCGHPHTKGELYSK